MSVLIKCKACGTPIAYGSVEAGAVQILCKRCGQKTEVLPAKKSA